MSAVFKFLAIAVSFSFILVFNTDAKVVVLLSVPHAANIRTHTNVGRALTEMGHESYVCIPHFMSRENVINVNGVKVIEYGEEFGDVDSKLFGTLGQNVFGREAPSIFDMLNLVASVKQLSLDMLADKDFVSKIREVKPDLILLTTVPPFRNIVVLPYMLNVPFVFMSPFADLSTHRVPFSLSSTACQLSRGFKEFDTSFMDRLKHFSCNSLVVFVAWFLTDDSTVAEFAPNRPQISMSELSRKTELFIVESDHILDYARPSVPNLKFVGGTAPTPPRPLKEPFKSFVEKAKSGVAVVTFGSAVVDLPEGVTRKMIKAFEQQNLQIVWRVNVTSPNPSKILTSRWVPQNDILAHSNTKLFVSHCGANGQYEALYHGVPILCLPLFGDQFYNAHRSASKEFGLSADLFHLSDKELAGLMKEIVENPKYKNNMQKASSLFRKLYKYPVKEAAFWIDHVMEYGGSYMRSSGQEMPLYQFLVLDIVAFLVLVVILILLFMYGFCLCCCRMCRKSNGSETSKKKGKRD